MAFRRRYRRSTRRSTFGRSRRFGRRFGMRSRRYGFGSLRTGSYTIQKGSGFSLPYRGRRMRRTAYRRALWRETQFKDHWRSFNSQVEELPTATSVTEGSLVALFPLTAVGADTNSFWTAVGGTVPKDLNVAVPDFYGVTIRGGKVRVRVVTPPGDTTSIYVVKVWVIWTNARPDLSNIPTSGPVDGSWDPSAWTDMDSEVGKTMVYREATLQGGVSPVLDVEYRLRVQKIDMDAYWSNNGLQPLFIVFAQSLNNNTSTTLGVFVEHNLSFAGDAGPTRAA